MLINYIRDAYSRNDFKEIGSNASVKSWNAFMGHNMLELADHRQLRSAISRSYSKEINRLCFFIFNTGILVNISGF